MTSHMDFFRTHTDVYLTEDGLDVRPLTLMIGEGPPREPEMTSSTTQRRGQDGRNYEEEENGKRRKEATPIQWQGGRPSCSNGLDRGMTVAEDLEQNKNACSEEGSLTSNVCSVVSQSSWISTYAYLSI